MQRFIHSARLLYAHGRIKPNRLSMRNANIDKMQKIMHSQVDLVKDQEDQNESNMMENVMKVHASDPTPVLSKDAPKEDADWYLDTAYNIPSKWETFIPRWKRSVNKMPSPVVLEDHPILEIAAVIDTIKKENGLNSVVINMTQKCDYTDAFIFTQGNNTRHVVAISEAVRKLV